MVGPYLAPYALYVLILSLPESVAPRAAVYAAATAASLVALLVGRRHHVPVLGPTHPLTSTALGVGAGLAGTALWVALKAPFYGTGGTAWPFTTFVARLVASSTVVAVFEELLFRGFLLRAAVQWESARRRGEPDPVGAVLHGRSVGDVAPGTWTPTAAAVSTVAFALGHAPGEWLAAVAYGLLMAAVSVRCKDLLAPIVAHATTNASLALWVRATGNWTLW